MSFDRFLRGLVPHRAGRPLARPSSLAASLVLAGLLLPLAASATPVRYDYFSGTTTARIVHGSTIIASGTAGMTGTFVTFDEAVPELVDFEFVIDDDNVMLGLFGSIDVFLVAVPAAGFSAPATLDPGGFYRWVGGPAHVAGVLSFTGGLLDGQIVPIDLLAPDLRGFFRTATLGDDTFGLADAIDVFDFDLFGRTYKLQVHVAFKGIVPEPATAFLVAGGLAALSLRRRPAA